MDSQEDNPQSIIYNLFDSIELETPFVDEGHYVRHLADLALVNDIWRTILELTDNEPINWSTDRQTKIVRLSPIGSGADDALSLFMRRKEDGSLTACLERPGAEGSPLKVFAENPSKPDETLLDTDMMEQYLRDAFHLPQGNEPVSAGRVYGWFENTNHRLAMIAAQEPDAVKPGEWAMRVSNGAFVNKAQVDRVIPTEYQQNRFLAMSDVVANYRFGVSDPIFNLEQLPDDVSERWNDPAAYWNDPEAQLYWDVFRPKGYTADELSRPYYVFYPDGDDNVDVQMQLMLEYWMKSNDDIRLSDTPADIAYRITNFGINSGVDPLDRPGLMAGLEEIVEPTFKSLTHDMPKGSMAFGIGLIKGCNPDTVTQWEIDNFDNRDSYSLGEDDSPEEDSMSMQMDLEMPFTADPFWNPAEQDPYENPTDHAPDPNDPGQQPQGPAPSGPSLV
ncbi:hypothetical protein [Bifidobacterium rousetti]|uniref:hypothetical protein n=1 Tax=Bifidobacterium rousetti TaxID=2045439 RepID=UPI00123AB42E|nr:hypothetical protein [Bifidobacterium rousetti]